MGQQENNMRKRLQWLFHWGRAWVICSVYCVST